MTWRDFLIAIALGAVLTFSSLTSLHSQDNSRYIHTPCGSIIDRSTQLEWYIGPDINMSWADSSSWIRELSRCDGGWQILLSCAHCLISNTLPAPGIIREGDIGGLT